MIDCEICGKWKSEGKFPRTGLTGVCFDCQDTPKANEMKKRAEISMKKAFEQQIQFENTHYNQVGKYDKW